MEYTKSSLHNIIREVLYEHLSEQDENLPITPEPQPETETVPEAPAPSTPSGEITRDEAKRLILATGRANGGKGGFFTVNFVKKDGTPRVMNARLDVKKYLKGGTLPYDARAMGYISVYDMVNKGYRMVNSNTITALNIGGRRYTVNPEATIEPGTPETTAPDTMNESQRMQKLAGILHD